MRALLQRVHQASVTVADQVVGEIGPGWLIFLGIARGDTEPIAKALVDKIAGLRCFEDGQGKTNLSAGDVGAEMLVVSQFTLMADVRRGRRPAFSAAAPADQACQMVRRFAELLRERGFRVDEGQFGARMLVASVNDGPFTIWLDSAPSQRAANPGIR